MTDWRYFTAAELACRHCGVERMDPAFMRKVERFREAAGFPFVVTSAYRCPDHNEAVSSTGRHGPHTAGRAIDVAADGDRAYYLITRAAEFGFTGIGVQQKGGARFVHLDDLMGGNWPRPAVWSY